MPRPDARGDGARPQGATARAERDLAQIDALARLMDAQFRLPLVGVRIGLDGLLGLVPGVGDLLVAAPGVWMIAKGWQHGARRRILLRMLANSGADLIVGTVPLVGDLFDIGFKANLRNARLLRREVTHQSASTRQGAAADLTKTG